MTTRLLIVDDELHILNPLLDYFEAEGYEVVGARDGEEAIARAREHLPDCVVLDIMLPKKDGITVCRELRRDHALLPIILLTARGGEGDRVLGLDSGADDYVTKPFGMLELHARVRAQLRRVRRTEAVFTHSGPVRFGRCVLDLEKRTLSRDGASLKVSAMALKLLEYLVAHEGAVIPREKLLHEVWGYERFPTTRTVDTHVWKLRQRLELDPNNPQHLLTVHGLGYRFVSQPES